MQRVHESEDKRRDPQFARRWRRRVAKRGDLKKRPAVRLALSVLANFGRKEGYGVRLGAKGLAREAGVSLSTAKRALRIGRDLGLIATTVKGGGRLKGGHGVGFASVYRLDFAPEKGVTNGTGWSPRKGVTVTPQSGGVNPPTIRTDRMAPPQRPKARARDGRQMKSERPGGNSRLGPNRRLSNPGPLRCWSDGFETVWPEDPDHSTRSPER
jgi:hypothetical protein